MVPSERPHPLLTGDTKAGLGVDGRLGLGLFDVGRLSGQVHELALTVVDLSF